MLRARSFHDTATNQQLLALANSCFLVNGNVCLPRSRLSILVFCTCSCVVADELDLPALATCVTADDVVLFALAICNPVRELASFDFAVCLAVPLTS